MKAGKITYHRAHTLEDAIGLATRLGSTAKYMAGGQSLMPMMNLRLTLSESVIDISSIPELREWKAVDDVQFIGAGVTHAKIEDGKVEDPARGYLEKVAQGIAYRSIRNRGTIGGSLAHADPAGDWPTALLALGAKAVIRGNDGQRTVALSDFQLGLMQTCLTETDLLEGVLLQRLSDRARWGYVKFCRKVGEFPHSICAVVVDPASGLANAVLGAAGSKPVILPSVSSRLKAGMRPDELAGDGFVSAISHDIAACTDHARTSYAFQLHKTIVKRAVAEAISK